MSKTNNQTETAPKQQSTLKNNKFQTKPIINSKFYFSKDGKYLIFERNEKHIFPASYHTKVVEAELQKQKVSN